MAEDREVHEPARTADFDLAGRAFEDAKAGPERRRPPAWVAWTVLAAIGLATAAFVADRGWQRPGPPYAQWIWPDAAGTHHVAHGGTRWVLDTRQPSIAAADDGMRLVGTFNGIPYYVPAGGGGADGEDFGPVYVRVGPDRYIPLVEGGPTPTQIKRRTLEGEPLPPAGQGR